MISWRWVTADELAAKMTPPFGSCANAARARSISLASRESIALNSTLDDDAADWIAANWPIPAANEGSRRTATRVTFGANSLSSSSHFPLMLYFVRGKSGGIASGPCHASDESRTDWVDDIRKHNRHAASDPQQRLHARTAGGKDDVRRQRDQFFCVSAIAIDIVSCPAGVSAHIAALCPI